MAVYKADGIVIRTREYGESDKLITIFSRDRGKLEAVAKGVRKPTSSQRGGTQLFTYADFLIYKGKSLDTVNQTHPKESFVHIWDDFDKTIAASCMAELLDIATVREQSDSELFALLLSFLFLLKHVDPYIAQASFTLKLMHIQGYLPVLDSCMECQRSLSAEQGFISQDGAIICAGCKNNKVVKAVGPGSLALMRQLLKSDLSKLDRLRWNPAMREEILNGLCFFCETRFERKLLAWRSGREMLPGG